MRINTKTLKNFNITTLEEHHHRPISHNDPEDTYLEHGNIGRWTVVEHELFLGGLKEYGRNWKSIQSMIKTRSATQVRTHAQKFFTRDHYNANKRGRYSSRLKDIETPEMLDYLKANGTLSTSSTACIKSESTKMKKPRVKKRRTYKKKVKKQAVIDTIPTTFIKREMTCSTPRFSSHMLSHQVHEPRVDTIVRTPFIVKANERHDVSIDDCIPEENTSAELAFASDTVTTSLSIDTSLNNDSSWKDYVKLEPLEFFTGRHSTIPLSPPNEKVNQDLCLNWLASPAEPPTSMFFTDFLDNSSSEEAPSDLLYSSGPERTQWIRE